MSDAPSTVTVKKADGTTDIVYTTITSASSDGSQWLLRAEAAGGPTGFRSTFSVSSKSNGLGTIRVVKFYGKMPHTYTDTNSGLVKTDGFADFSATFNVPASLPSSHLAELAAQFTELMATSYSKDAISTGYAPT